MKILQINSVFGRGSTGRIMADLAQSQEKVGILPAVAYGQKSEYNDVEYPVYKIGQTEFNVYEHILEARFFDNGGFASRKATYNFVKQIRQFKPDIVHLHNLHGYYINVAILFKELSALSCKVVITLHDCWMFSPQSAYLELDKSGKVPATVSSVNEYQEYPRTYCHRSQRLLAKKKAVFTSLDADQVEIVTPSIWLTNLAKKSFLNKYRIRTIHNGIDLNKFHPYAKNYLQDHFQIGNKKIILGVANIWEQRKGLTYFNNLANMLTNDYQIVVVGRLNRNEYLSDKIIQIKQTNNIAELSQIYSAADIFINPTLADNFPTTNIESLASGTPVITFKTGGSPESLNAVTGRVVTKGDMNQLVEACKTVVKTPDMIKSCVDRAQLFSKEICYDKYLGLYKNLKGGK